MVIIREGRERELEDKNTYTRHSFQRKSYDFMFKLLSFLVKKVLISFVRCRLQTTYLFELKQLMFRTLLFHSFSCLFISKNGQDNGLERKILNKNCLF